MVHCSSSIACARTVHLGLSRSCDFLRLRTGRVEFEAERDLGGVDACLSLGDRVAGKASQVDLGADLAGAGAIDLPAGSRLPARPAVVGRGQSAHARATVP
jgi:hypothetical protein